MSVSKPQRILIVNIFGIGDVLFTTPMVRNIKENLPDCFLGFVCNARAKGVLINNPYIDKVFVYEKDYYRGLAKSSRLACLKEFLSFLKSIRIERFDFAFDLSLNSQAGFFLWILGIRKRVGFKYKNRGKFLTDAIKIEGYEGKHVAQFYLGLLKHLNFKINSINLDIFLSADEKEEAVNFLKSNGVSGKDLLIAIVPGAGASWGKDAVVKHWPAENFAKVADKCIEKFKAKIIISGDSLDFGVCDRVFKAIKNQAIQVCGKTDLRQFLALLSRCNLVITNDGGPLHMAVALGVKTVSLFGPVDEKVYGPFPSDYKRHIVVKKELNCRPCYRRFRMADCDRRICLEEISSDEVFKAVEELI